MGVLLISNKILHIMCMINFNEISSVLLQVGLYLEGIPRSSWKAKPAGLAPLKNCPRSAMKIEDGMVIDEILHH